MTTAPSITARGKGSTGSKIALSAWVFYKTIKMTSHVAHGPKKKSRQHVSMSDEITLFAPDELKHKSGNLPQNGKMVCSQFNVSIVYLVQ
ncbi:hypothetical protein CEXT_36491 [Caerostris extrusa]|uniref:Uncharacterized protein n=1 Tax=Caerostris extrusa TaxID=172846 RepID=A0AAV4V2T6_CAEEX|nr:hypothetical protein CEXT_36491 [Caerostris extrusa]